MSDSIRNHGAAPARLKLAYRRAHDRARAAIDASRLLDLDHSVLVFSMRKVASTSVTRTLRAAGLEVHKQHCLDWDNRAVFEARLDALGLQPQAWLSQGRSYARRLARTRTRASESGKRLRVISLIRDPIAVAVSDFFMQCFELLPARSVGPAYREEATILTLLGRLLEGRELYFSRLEAYLGSIVTYPQHWLSSELQPLVGIDAHALRIVPGEGYAVLRSESAELLILRSDDLAHVATDALTSFLGTPFTSLRSANCAAQKSYAGLYARVRDRLTLPLALIDDIYGRFGLDRFYTAAEIEQMRGRWSGDTALSAAGSASDAF